LILRILLDRGDKALSIQHRPGSSHPRAFRSWPAVPDVQVNHQPGSGEHIHQCVNGEESDFAPGLAEPFLFDVPGEGDHHFCPESKILSIGGCKPAIEKNIFVALCRSHYFRLSTASR
jgi:hypothetical protein